MTWRDNIKNWSIGARKWILIPLLAIVFCCAILKAFCDYPRWPINVVAISISSYYLSLADFLLPLTFNLEKEADEQMPGIRKILEKSTRIEKCIKGCQEQAIWALAGKDDILFLQKTRFKIRRTIRFYRCKKTQKINAHKQNNKNLIFGYCLTILGYAVLIYLMAFGPTIENGACNLEELSVWSFFFLLLGKLLGPLQDILRVRSKKKITRCLKWLDLVEYDLKARGFDYAD